MYSSDARHVHFLFLNFLGYFSQIIQLHCSSMFSVYWFAVYNAHMNSNLFYFSAHFIYMHDFTFKD